MFGWLRKKKQDPWKRYDAEQACRKLLIRAGSADPRIRGIYFFPLGCEGGYLTEEGICIQFDSSVPESDRQAIMHSLALQVSQLEHGVAMWETTDEENIQTKFGTMRTDVYVRKN